MNRRTLIAALLACAAAAVPAIAQTPPVTVETPWARASVGNSRIAVAYMTLRNGGAAPDRALR